MVPLVSLGSGSKVTFCSCATFRHGGSGVSVSGEMNQVSMKIHKSEPVVLEHKTPLFT